MNKLYYSSVQSSACNVGLVWVEKEKSVKIVRIFLAENKDDVLKQIKRFFSGAKQEKDRVINFIVKKIKDYLDGEIVHYGERYLDNTLCSRFQWKLLRRVRQIPYGKVITYKGLARLTDTKSARTIGNALAKNPFPIIIPCHRVVNSNGTIGGFQSGKRLKRHLLKLEGITFDKKGKIPKEYFV